MVDGVDKNDDIVVEIWVVLQDEIQPGTAGNVPSALEAAYANGGTQDVSGGKQTVPLLQVKDFFTATADLSIVKADDPDPVTGGNELTYTITVTNNSTDTVANLVSVSDTLDANTTLVSADPNSGDVQCWHREFHLRPRCP